MVQWWRIVFPVVFGSIGGVLFILVWVALICMCCRGWGRGPHCCALCPDELRVHPLQYNPNPMQTAPAYFYPQGYIPPPPPQMVIDERLAAIFRKLDKDNSGSIDINEAIIGAKEFGALGYFLASEEQVKGFFAAADKNKDQRIDWIEFSNISRTISAKYPNPQAPQMPPPPRYAPVVDERLTAIFRKLDKDNSGGIDINEAMIGVKEFGALGYFLASDEEVRAFFAAADKNRDNKLDYNEFSSMAGALAAKHPHPQPPKPSSSCGEPSNQTRREPEGFPASTVSLPGRPQEMTVEPKFVAVDL